MKNYKCDICGKKHSTYYSTESPIPEVLNNYENRTEEIEQIAENAFILNDKDLIISGDLFIQTDFSQSDMSHRIWVKVDAKELHFNYENLKKGIEIKLFAEILSEVPFIN